MKIGDLVHFVEPDGPAYNTLGMIREIYYPVQHALGVAAETLYEVEWYDDDYCGIEDYCESDLEVVSEGWRFRD